MCEGVCVVCLYVCVCVCACVWVCICACVWVCMCVYSIWMPFLSHFSATQVLCNVLMCLRLEAMWTLHSLDVNSPQADTVKWLKARLQHLVEQCLELVKFGSALGQREAFVTLCDLLVMFAKQLNNIGMFNPLNSTLWSPR